MFFSDHDRERLFCLRQWLGAVRLRSTLRQKAACQIARKDHLVEQFPPNNCGLLITGVVLLAARGDRR
jgi:hypothetical protein